MWKRYNWLWVRTVTIAFFVGLNYVLGVVFLSQNAHALSHFFTHPLVRSLSSSLPHLVLHPLDRLLQQYGIDINTSNMVTQYGLATPHIAPTQRALVLQPTEIIAVINRARAEHDLPALASNSALASAAAQILTEVAEHNYDVDVVDGTKPLATLLEEVQYPYAWAHHNTLVGPLTAEAALTAWLSDAAEAQALLAPECSDIGLAAAIVDTSFMGKAGVIVQLLGQPKATTSASVRQDNMRATPSLAPKSTVVTQQTVQHAPLRLAEFEDEAVLEALNTYRAAHGVHPLKHNDHLCTYAQKRVEDLRAHGALDGHAGFRTDFETAALPVGIQAYGAGSFAENLASQYCINGTTGEIVYVAHPTQLIEWCFDSSQKGHRETQLSEEFDDVCVRHGDNMYVVIFGQQR